MLKKTLLAITASMAFSSLANADVVLIANSKMPADSLDKTLVANVFLGKAFSTGDGYRLIPVERTKDNPAKEAFHSFVTGKTLGQLNAYWSRLIFTGKNAPPNEIDDDEEVIELVKGNENLIGYIESESLTPDVKVLLTVK